MSLKKEKEKEITCDKLFDYSLFIYEVFEVNSAAMAVGLGDMA